MTTTHPPFAGTFQELKERQLVFHLVRQLAEAQFMRADRRRSDRLWQEAVALDLDPERLTALLYGVGDHADDAEMEAIDRPYRTREQPGQRRWPARNLRHRLMPPRHGAGHRNAPPAAARALPPDR